MCLPEIARFGQIHRSRNDNCDRGRPGNRAPNLPLDSPPASHSCPAAACGPAPVTATLRVCLRGVPASSARKKWKAKKRISHKISQWVRAQGFGDALGNRFPVLARLFAHRPNSSQSAPPSKSGSTQIDEEPKNLHRCSQLIEIILEGCFSKPGFVDSLASYA